MPKLMTAVLLTAALAACGLVKAPLVSTYTLPGNAVYPEGIAHRAGSQNFYVGSTTDGTIFRGTLGKAATEVFLAPTAERPTAIGMKVDEQGRLFIAGGPSGKVFVYDTASKALIQAFSTPAATATFLNDVTLTPDAAYITDSQRPVLFRIGRTAGGLGTLESWLDFTGTPLQYVAGFNLNGIASTPDGKYLIVVQSNTGKLFRITVADKSVTEINLGGAAVTSGDGILLSGQTLYVVRNSAVLIVPVALSADFSSGTLGTAFTDPSLRFPTTIAQEGNRLLVVNSQFDKRGPGLTPELPFTVSNVALPR
ncbi:superoxide dismutase [Deinococcus koreensis]|uniref:Superoxide dismutase n=2 Tax=Deinococcus koreensis TaxID=2054903 RepID=A0A2K3V095_9DEIO|nr:superoxide dismutase [Deinococcus koreensis]